MARMGRRRASPPLEPVHAYTDGSFEAGTNTSSWAVTIADDWFDASIATISSDEKLLQPMHVRGATMLGARIRGTLFFF